MRRTEGFTVLEVLIAVVLMAVVVLAVAPMFMMASARTAAGADFGRVGAMAVERMEVLRAASYDGMTAGGSLVTDATVGGTPYFDASVAGYVVRWQVTDNATADGGKRLAVRVLSMRQVSGVPKEVTLTALRVR